MQQTVRAILLLPLLTFAAACSDSFAPDLSFDVEDPTARSYNLSWFGGSPFSVGAAGCQSLGPQGGWSCPGGGEPSGHGSMPTVIPVGTDEMTLVLARISLSGAIAGLPDTYWVYLVFCPDPIGANETCPVDTFRLEWRGDYVKQGTTYQLVPSAVETIWTSTPPPLTIASWNATVAGNPCPGEQNAEDPYCLTLRMASEETADIVALFGG